MHYLKQYYSLSETAEILNKHDRSISTEEDIFQLAIAGRIKVGFLFNPFKYNNFLLKRDCYLQVMSLQNESDIKDFALQEMVAKYGDAESIKNVLLEAKKNCGSDPLMLVVSIKVNDISKVLFAEICFNEDFTQDRFLSLDKTAIVYPKGLYLKQDGKVLTKQYVSNDGEIDFSHEAQFCSIEGKGNEEFYFVRELRIKKGQNSSFYMLDQFTLASLVITGESCISGDEIKRFEQKHDVCDHGLTLEEDLPIYQSKNHPGYAKELDEAIKAYSKVFKDGIFDKSKKTIDRLLRNSYPEKSENWYERIATVIKPK